MENQPNNTAVAVSSPNTGVFQAPVMFAPTGGIFASPAHFAQAEKFAQILAASTLVPDAYRKNPENCLIALDFAGNVGVPVMMVMQNLDIVKGKPGFNAKFILAAIRGCGRFTSVHHVHAEDGVVAKAWVAPSQGLGREVENIPNYTCYLSATSMATGLEVRSPLVSIKMAVAEGWYGSAGSKWPNMPHLMLEYRTGSFFGRTQISDILLGMASGDELEDVARSEAGGRDAGTGAEVLPGMAVEAATRARGSRQRREAPAYACPPHTDNDTGTGAAEDVPTVAETPQIVEAAAQAPARAAEQPVMRVLPAEPTRGPGGDEFVAAMEGKDADVRLSPHPDAAPTMADMPLRTTATAASEAASDNPGPPAGWVLSPAHLAVLVKVANEDPQAKQLSEVERALVKEFGAAYADFIILPSRVTGRFVITQAGNEFLADQVEVYNEMVEAQANAPAAQVAPVYAQTPQQVRDATQAVQYGSQPTVAMYGPDATGRFHAAGSPEAMAEWPLTGNPATERTALAATAPLTDAVAMPDPLGNLFPSPAAPATTPNAGAGF